MDPTEVALLRETVAAIVASADGSELTVALDAFGWPDLLRDHPTTAIPAVFDAQGGAGRWSAALHDVLARDLPPGPSHRCVAVPRPRRTAAGVVTAAGTKVDAILLGARQPRATFVIPVIDDAGAIAVLEVPGHLLDVAPARGLAPRFGIAALTGTVTQGSVILNGDAAATWWINAQAAARLALAHDIGAAVRTMFELARDHARERVQFGRQIGTFQAVRHKLADVFVAVEATDAAVAAAWEADDRPLAAAAAKLVASRAVATTSAHTQQVLAGIGFTADHPFHHHMKRVTVLDRILGGAAELAPLVGRQLVEHGRAPRLVEL